MYPTSSSLFLKNLFEGFFSLKPASEPEPIFLVWEPVAIQIQPALQHWQCGIIIFSCFMIATLLKDS